MTKQRDQMIPETPSPEAAKPKCQPIVYFLHGLLETAHHQFLPQVRAWKDSLTLVPIDLPGHGRCRLDAQSGYIATSTKYALAVMARFGRGHVLGASYLGGPVAVRCAFQRPDLLESLVLTGFVPDVPQNVFAGWIDGFSRLASENQQLVRWYEQQHGPRWQDTLNAYLDDVRQRYTECVCVSSEMLGKLRLPTLIANGSEKSNERAVALAAGRYGPFVRGHVIAGAGHIPGNDRPEELNNVVFSFWKEIADGCEVASA